MGLHYWEYLVQQDPFCFEPNFGVFILLTVSVYTGFFPLRDKKKSWLSNAFSIASQLRKRPDSKGRDEEEKRKAVLFESGALLTLWGEADSNT